MKKLFLLLVLATFVATGIKAQKPSGYSVPIVTYKVDTTAYSHGLTIPAPFYFSVQSLTAEIDTAVGFMLLSYTVNSTDSLVQNKISNDSIPAMKIYPMTITDVDTLTLDGMVEKYILQNLKNLYGDSNVTKQ